VTGVAAAAGAAVAAPVACTIRWMSASLHRHHLGHFVRGQHVVGQGRVLHQVIFLLWGSRLMHNPHTKKC
jgi:hypothetical protein